MRPIRRTPDFQTLPPPAHVPPRATSQPLSAPTTAVAPVFYVSANTPGDTRDTDSLNFHCREPPPPPPAPPPPDASARGHFGGAGWGKVPRQVPLLLRTAPSMRRNAGTWSNLCCFVRRLAALLQARTGTAHPRHVRARSTAVQLYCRCTVGQEIGSLLPVLAPAGTRYRL
eukprot:COSAG01_NODE_1834_length_9105_cov_35.595603_12_plen_171_part_00